MHSELIPSPWPLYNRLEDLAQTEVPAGGQHCKPGSGLSLISVITY